MQIQLTKYVNKMQTSVQCEKITFESPTPNNHMFKSYIYVSRMLSNNKLYAHKTPFSNKQTIQKTLLLIWLECPEFSVENGNAIE